MLVASPGVYEGAESRHWDLSMVVRCFSGEIMQVTEVVSAYFNDVRAKTKIENQNSDFYSKVLACFYYIKLISLYKHFIEPIVHTLL